MPDETITGEKPEPKQAKARKKPTVKVMRLTPGIEIPEQAREGDAAFDLRAHLYGGPNRVIPNNAIELIGTGLSVEIPDGYVGLIVPRSGLALAGVSIANTPGVIDSGYRGEVNMAVVNRSGKPFVVASGDRIAQLLVLPLAMLLLEEAEELSESQRGDGGFGSTGVA